MYFVSGKKWTKIILKIILVDTEPMRMNPQVFIGPNLHKDLEMDFEISSTLSSSLLYNPPSFSLWNYTEIKLPSLPSCVPLQDVWYHREMTFEFISSMLMHNETIFLDVCIGIFFGLLFELRIFISIVLSIALICASKWSLMNIS